jgi:hypothetical protein
MADARRARDLGSWVSEEEQRQAELDQEIQA